MSALQGASRSSATSASKQRTASSSSCSATSCWPRSMIWRCFVAILVLWLVTILSTFSSHKKAVQTKDDSTMAAARISRRTGHVSSLHIPPKRPTRQMRQYSINKRIAAPTPAIIPFDAVKFQQWMNSQSATNANTTTVSNESVLVLITKPYGASDVALVKTIRDALSSPNVQLLVYVGAVARDVVATNFADEMQHGVLVLLGRNRGSGSSVNDDLGPRLQDDLDAAHLLALAAQSLYVERFHFTLLLRAGMRLVNVTTNDTAGAAGATDFMNGQGDYTKRAVGHYRFLQSLRQQALFNDTNRTCLTLLSNEIDASTMPAALLETAEHASRLSMTLRSTLPYQNKHTTDIVDYYCRRILWETKKAYGPTLFVDTLPSDATLKRLPATPPFLNASQFVVPPWIDSAIPVGPVIYDGMPNYTIAFGVTTMTRPVKGNDYLIQFMTELLKIVESDFSKVDAKTFDKYYQAVIVLLVSGNTVEDIASHRAFLTLTYQTAIARGIVVLVDAPLQSSVATLQKLRRTFPAERHERRYWRSKQNLDIAATLRAAAGMSAYIMLLEDDTGFQPGFGTSLQATIKANVLRPPHGIPLWSVAEYGFGYSGVLIHASDVHVFEQIHQTFYDERPCDLFKIDKLVRKGRVQQVLSRKKFANRKASYLKHNGKISSLEGKTQDVW